MNWSYARLLRLAVIVPVLLVLVSMSLLLASWKRTDQATAWLTASYQLRTSIDNLLSEMREVESLQRGFLITGAEAFLEPYPDAARSAREHLAQLEALSEDNPHHESQLPHLRQLVVAKLDRADELIRLQRAGRTATATGIVADGEGKALMDALRHRLDEMAQSEQIALNERLDHLAHSISLQRTVAAGIIIGQIMLGLTVSILSHKLATLRQLVTMCAWSKKIKFRGKWMGIEEYLAAHHRVDITHGISPEEYEKQLPPGRRTPSAASA